MKKITLLGTFPPPIGGTSIHVYRLFRLLKENYRVQGVDTYGRSNLGLEGIKSFKNYKVWLLKFLFKSNDLIHSHSHSWNERIVLRLVAILKRNKVVFTYHSLRENARQLSKLKLLLIKYLLNSNTTHIVPNNEIKKQLIEYGIYNNNIQVIPTFLLPDKDDNEEIPHYVSDFINNSQYVISANASNNNKYEGVDLYGIDLCVELCRKINEFLDVKFIFCLTEITDKSAYQEIKEKINKYSLNDRFLIVNENISLQPILKASSLFIRPTYYDSYGISVGEAISLGIPCIASDVCKRTEGAIIFKSRNIDDLFLKTKSALLDHKTYSDLIQGINVPDNSEDMLRLYESLLNEK